MSDDNLCDGSQDGCTGGNEFMTAPCPIHSGRGPRPFGDGVMTTITDEYMVPERQRMWEGFCFQCPNCQAESIMVNQYTAPNGVAVCCNPECGKKAHVNSHIVTDFVKKLTLKMAQRRT